VKASVLTPSTDRALLLLEDMELSLSMPASVGMSAPFEHPSHDEMLQCKRTMPPRNCNIVIVQKE
jgi:hypothetical protein